MNAIVSRPVELLCSKDGESTAPPGANEIYLASRGDGGYFTNSVQIELNEAEETAELVLEADDLDDGQNPGRQVWNAVVYKRGNEILIMNFEAKDSDLWDGGIWYCRVVASHS